MVRWPVVMAGWGERDATREDDPKERIKLYMDFFIEIAYSID